MIDAHLQLWSGSRPQPQPADPGQAPLDHDFLDHDFLLPELEDTLDMSGVRQVISIQPQASLSDNHWLLKQARQSDERIAGVVLWVPLGETSLQPLLEQYRHEPLIKGIHATAPHSHPEALFDNLETDLRIREISEHQLSLDLLATPHQLPALIRFADKHPDLAIALNHCGKPQIHPEGLKHPESQSWARHIRELARRPHVYCKLSGLSAGLPPQAQPLRWYAPLLQPYTDAVLQAFSPSRLMFGSDWPRSTQNTPYPTWLNTIDDLISPLEEEEKWAIGEGTATRFYRLAEK